MATSKTDICNLAMDLLNGGIVQDIDAPTTTTEETLARWYDQCRKQVLREHPWNFATKRQIIAASSTDPAFGYTAAFPLPNDCIRILTIESDEGLQILPENYQVEDHEGVKAILITTDATSVRLRYIYNIEDVTRFDALFVSYLALTIAISIAYKVTGSNGNVERVQALLKEQGNMSKAISGQERTPTRIERSKNRRTRRGGSDRYAHRIAF